jgi:hypothetical protein
LTERTKDADESLLYSILCIVVAHYQSADVPIERFFVLGHQQTETLLRILSHRTDYFFVACRHTLLRPAKHGKVKFSVQLSLVRLLFGDKEFREFFGKELLVFLSP